jgi:hypothetical protein
MFDTGSGQAIDNLAITMDDPNRRNHIGSSFDNGMYGHVNKDLRQVLALPVVDHWSRTYCGNGALDVCRAALWASLGQAAADLQSEFGSANVVDWRRAIADEDIRHTTVGVTSVPAIEWINRPTFQQVVQLGDATDPFKCYSAKPQPGTSGPPPRTVDLVDEVESKSTVVSRPAGLCNAANVEQQGLKDSTAHLACYRIKAAPDQAPFSPLNVSVSNQFGASALTLTKAWNLCVPSADDGNSAAQPLDRYKCYRARRAAGSSRFARRDVQVVDEFEAKNTTVRKPYAVCMPVNENGAGLIDRTAHFACYQIADTPGQPRFTPRDVAVSDELGAHSSTARTPATLCVPSTIVSQ